MDLLNADDYTCYTVADSAKYVDKDKNPIAEFSSSAFTVDMTGEKDTAARKCVCMSRVKSV